jgi:hypothetical protein
VTATVLEKYQIDMVLWVKAHEELRRFLVDKRGWKEEYAGLYQSVYVKPQRSPQPISRLGAEGTTRNPTTDDGGSLSVR